MDYETPSIIAKIGGYLRKPPSINDLTELETLRYDLAKQTSEQLLLLYHKRAQMLLPRDKEFTELDRKVSLEASVAVIEADYLFLERLNTLVSERIKLATLLNQGN